MPSPNTIYHYLKTKADFFTNPSVFALESEKNGFLFSNIYLKMCLASMNTNGRFAITETLPFTPKDIANLTRHSVRTVEKALEKMEKYNLIEILPSGVIYIPAVPQMVGKSSTEADRVAEYRARKEAEKKKQKDSEKCTEGVQMYTHVELEKELEQEVEYSDMPAASQTLNSHIPPTFSAVRDYCRGKNVNAEHFWNYYNNLGWKTKSGAPIDNWHQLVDHWDKTEHPKASEPEPKHKPSYDLDEYEKYDIFSRQDSKEKSK